MKSFKDIKNYISESYYQGPTAYAAGGNLGDIAGSDLGGFANGANTPYANSINFDEILTGLNNVLAGIQSDVVGALAKARAMLNISGLSYDLDPRVVREAVPSGTFESQLNFYGHRLGEPKSDADKFIDDLVTSATGTDRIESTLPFTTVVFNFEPVQRGFIIKAMFK